MAQQTKIDLKIFFYSETSTSDDPGDILHEYGDRWYFQIAETLGFNL